VTRWATPKLAGYAGLSAAGLLSALVFARPELVALTAPFLLALAAGLVYLSVRSDGFRRIDGVLRRIAGLERFADAGDAEALDRAIFGAFRARPRDLAAAVLCFLGAWSVGVVEARLILEYLRAPVSWGTAFAIESLSVLIETAFFFVPAKMGTQEGGKVAIFAALGLETAKGFSMGFVRRLRELFWALVGLAAFAALERRGRIAGPPVKRDVSKP